MKKHIPKINSSTKTIILILFVMICHSMAFSQTNQNTSLGEQTEPPILSLEDVKTDEYGREYIDDPNSPNGRVYRKKGPDSWEIMKKAAEENILPKEWLQNSPIHYKAADGYSTNMDYETLSDPQKREKFLAKEQAKHLQSQIHVGLVFIIAIIFIILFSIFLIKYLKK